MEDEVFEKIHWAFLVSYHHDDEDEARDIAWRTNQKQYKDLKEAIEAILEGE